MSQFALPRWPVFEADELAAVDAVLRSGNVNYWTSRECHDFEAAWSSAHGGRRSISMANGSLTLDVAMRALEIGPGDEVIVSPRSYVASAMCVVLAGAKPIFADVDPISGCINHETAEAVRSPRTRAVIPVHVGGWPCDMPKLLDWAQGHGIRVIEDCAQAHGGHIDGRPLGTFGAIASWSFCQDKIVTTGGEGGMLSTDEGELYERCWSLSQHGKERLDATRTIKDGDAGRFRWLVTREGTNLRMTSMQAAIGIRQLGKLPEWSEARRRNAGIMQDALRTIANIEVPPTPPGHAHYRCTAFTSGEDAAPLRDELIASLRESGLAASTGSCGEVYREKLFQSRGFSPAHAGRGAVDDQGRLRVARQLADTSLAFLVHHTIDRSTMQDYAGLVRDCIVRTIAGRGPSGRTCGRNSPCD